MHTYPAKMTTLTIFSWLWISNQIKWNLFATRINIM